MKPIQIELRDDGDWKVTTFTGQELILEKQENVLSLIASQLKCLKELQRGETDAWYESKHKLTCPN